MMSLPLPANDLTLDPDLRPLAEVEWEHIRRVLTACGGNISVTARVLRIDRRTLQRKLKEASGAPDTAVS
jgi:two-component system, response regulator RegA